MSSTQQLLMSSPADLSCARLVDELILSTYSVCFGIKEEISRFFIKFDIFCISSESLYEISELSSPSPVVNHTDKSFHLFSNLIYKLNQKETFFFDAAFSRKLFFTTREFIHDKLCLYFQYCYNLIKSN
jgi:hypothetical protein